MKLTIKNIIEAKDAVLALGNVKSVDGFPVQGQTAYKIKKFQDKFIKEFNTIDPSRIDIFKKHGKQNEKGYVTVLPEKFKEFQEEMGKFVAIETELDAPVFEIGIPDGMSANDITVLERNGILKEISE